jgi:acetate kinase
MSTTDDLAVVCVNTGSSSVKCAVFDVGADGEREVARVAVEDIGGDGPPDHRAALDLAFARLGDAASAVKAAGHRVVHGGPDHVEPARVDDALLADLRAAVALAPLHLPPSIAGIEAVSARLPGLPQVACFDTAFHRTLPERAWRLALPRELADAGVRKYGFHGLSYEYVVSTVGAETLGRAVVAHLGNGASLAAIADGRSIDTSMGLTPTGGIPMGTRSGDLDPGVLLWLLRARGADVDALEQLVDAEGGLLGLSGGTSSMRDLLDARASDEAAAIAVEVFCYRVCLQVGAYAAALGGLDSLVFTGGIGERSAVVRAEVCTGLAHLGVALDSRRNEQDADVISADGAPCTVRVVKTDEDRIVARHTRAVLAG